MPAAAQPRRKIPEQSVLAGHRNMRSQGSARGALRSVSWTALFLCAWMAFSACATAGPEPIQAPSPTPQVPASAPAAESPTAQEDIGPTFPAVPSATPLPTDTASPTTTPHPIFPYTLAGLRERSYPGGAIRTLNVLETGADFSRSYIAFESDGLSITGILHLPAGPGPFPVIVLLHGYWPRETYWSGADTWQAAEFFARRGYLAVAPDYRSWGESDWGPSLFQTGLVIDTLNLISALETLPQADTSRLGLWGHSMGGGIATKVLAVDPRPKAAVLYAPNSPDDADLIARWGPGCRPGQSQATDACNPSEIIPADLPGHLVEAYFQAADDPELLRQVGPYYHLERVQAPVQIHIGTADGAALSETPPVWSEKLRDGLQATGKPVEYYSYQGQGHSFTGESWASMAERSLAFFDRYLRGR